MRRRILPRAFAARSLLAAVAVWLAACGSSETPPDNAAWESRSGYRTLGEDESGEADVGATQPVGFDWAGVRLDLAISPQQARKEVCSCLAVEVGRPLEPKFVWRGVRPEVNPSNLAIAISAVGVNCPGGAPNEGDRRPSISGIFAKDKDVIVEVEEVPIDRPIASGAIIRPPDPSGKIFIRPRNNKLPYAKVANREYCRVM
jgi:hypothetical protein